MPTERIRAVSHSILQLAQKLREQRYRHNFVGAHIRQFLARQMRAFRGEKSQEEFAEWLGTSQTIVSRLEDPDYGKWTLRTLLKVAARLDVAVIVRFVDYKTFLRFADDVSEDAANPRPFDPISVAASARHEGDKRVQAIEDIAAAMSGWDRGPLSLAHEIRTLLKPIADQGTSIDSGGGDGHADLWVKIDGVEYYITIQRSKSNG